MALEYSDAARVARALSRACEEHTWEGNSFRAGELHAFYGAPAPLQIGLIMRHWHDVVARELGLCSASLVYDRGRFQVLAAPEPPSRMRRLVAR